MRLNLLLLGALTACALALVTSQHHARKLFAQIEQEQERTRSLAVEYGQLQLEQSTWAMHARVEKIAGGYLRMRVPPPERVRLVTAEPQSASAPRRSQR